MLLPPLSHHCRRHVGGHKFSLYTSPVSPRPQTTHATTHVEITVPRSFRFVCFSLRNSSRKSNILKFRNTAADVLCAWNSNFREHARAGECLRILSLSGHVINPLGCQLVPRTITSDRAVYTIIRRFLFLSNSSVWYDWIKMINK